MYIKYMINMRQLKILWLRLLSYLPSKLPQGVTELEVWSKSIITAYNMPDNDSVKFALCTAIMHLDSTAAYKPKSYFGKLLIKGAASQVAASVFQELKLKQQEAIKAVQQQEATQQAVVNETIQTPIQV